MLGIRLSRMAVYTTETSEISPTALAPELQFRRLEPASLQSIDVGGEAFRERQKARLDRFGASYAFGMFLDSQLAHISWLLPASAMERDVPRVIRATPAIGEITACETLPEYRGKGLYPMAISQLAYLAGSQGIRRIYMKTAVGNQASRAGIEKAGLRQAGSAILLWLPRLRQPLILRRFG